MTKGEHDDQHDETQPEAASGGTGGFTGKHARHATADTHAKADAEMARLAEFAQGEDAVTEHADKTHPPEGKPSKPA